MARRGHHEFSNGSLSTIEEYILRNKLAKIGIFHADMKAFPRSVLLELAEVGSAINAAAKDG